MHTKSGRASPLRGSAGGRGPRSAGATRERRAVLGFLSGATSERLGMALAGAQIGAARLPREVGKVIPCNGIHILHRLRARAAMHCPREAARAEPQ